MSDWTGRNRGRPPHPDSPAGRTFDWSALGVPHPNSPAGRHVDFSPSGVGNELDCIKAVIAKAIGGNKSTRSAEADFLTSLFMRAVALMDFSTDPNIGILYSGEQGGVYMSNQAKQYASKHGKRPLAGTKDGRWLNSWEPISALVGAKNSDQIWFAASIRYTNLLIGDVVIFLAAPDYDAVFRRRGMGEQRALYNNNSVKRILYVIEHPAPGFDQPKKAPNGRAWFFPSIGHLDDFIRSNP